MISLAGTRALVTGGSRGIGAATARLLASCGADVGIGYRSRAEDAEAVAAACRALGVRAFAHASDIGTAAGAEALAARAAREFGGLDLFVGNAGIWPTAEESVQAMGDARWANTMRENVDGMFFTTRAALRVMADGGRVVLVSSTAGQRGESMHADYAASKGAMISFVKSLAIECAPRGITVNSVAPGWVDTEMCDEPFAGGGRARIAATIPVGRIATPEDIAGPIVFLCSAQARHITGEILNVNGGSVLAG
ncbi:MAG TPA: SDR family oxidoreductase [Gemmatimonadaceae bacterium]|nr:SDR family oxidoreductase [Gemmatimonadaceae bacterium]